MWRCVNLNCQWSCSIAAGPDARGYDSLMMMGACLVSLVLLCFVHAEYPRRMQLGRWNRWNRWSSSPRATWALNGNQTWKSNGNPCEWMIELQNGGCSIANCVPEASCGPDVEVPKNGWVTPKYSHEQPWRSRHNYYWKTQQSFLFILGGFSFQIVRWSGLLLPYSDRKSALVFFGVFAASNRPLAKSFQYYFWLALSILSIPLWKVDLLWEYYVELPGTDSVRNPDTVDGCEILHHLRCLKTYK